MVSFKLWIAKPRVYEWTRKWHYKLPAFDIRKSYIQAQWTEMQAVKQNYQDEMAKEIKN